MTASIEEFFIFIIGAICIALSLYGSLKILSKYFKYKRTEFIYVGIAGIIMTEPWWPNLINNILIIIIQDILPFEIFNLIALVGLPIGMFFWIAAITELIYKEKQREILIVIAIYGIIFETVLIPLSFIDPFFTGALLGIQSFWIVASFLVSFSIIILVTGGIFAIQNLKSDNPEIRLKGRFLLYAFVSFSIVDIIYIFIALPPFLFALIYVGLLSSAISFYYGFVSSKRMIKIFIRTKKEKQRIGSIEF